MLIGAPKKQCKLQPIQPCSYLSNLDLDLFDLEKDYFYFRLDDLKQSNQSSCTFLKRVPKGRNRSSSILTNGSQVIKSHKKLKTRCSNKKVRFSLTKLES